MKNLRNKDHAKISESTVSTQRTTNALISLSVQIENIFSCDTAHVLVLRVFSISLLSFWHIITHRYMKLKDDTYGIFLKV